MARASSTRWTSIGEEPATTAAGCRRRRASASTRDRSSGRGRDLVDDRGGELAGRRPQVLLPADGVGAGVEVGGDGRGVLGVVGVEGVGGQIVR